MQKEKSFSFTYYGPFDLDYLREIVKDTDNLPGDIKVTPGITSGDRPFESESHWIRIGSY